ncbi:IclR family transcriptional regulator [Pseudooceanicola lipolyticus]|uniref:IclR family transcriptional regulator n=1 Tax=Pseudooceanicola lipolyticus TaxID=2029104 RepID=A0A2M8J1Q1_9RHOB|nr:IclR family transcriptional regulator [Pseudooceanicola lipolyticus]PJE36707.1 IclR family transcriptional regulator [Pseudooceanicola lipolyticus]
MIKHRYPQVDENLRVKTADRVLDVLECFAAPPNQKSLGEIAAATGINKSAVQRICRTLVGRGYLEQSQEARLRLGPALLERSFDFLRFNPLIERGSPILLDLRRETKERVDLSLFDPYHDNLSIIYAFRLQSKRETLYATLSGRRFPAASTSGGRACMAHLPDQTIDEIIDLSDLKRITPQTIIDPEGIWEKIRFGREHGYCLAVEEALLGEIVLAAAVLNSHGQPIGAIHIAGSLNTWTPQDFCDRFAPLAMSAAQAISG